MSTWGNLLADIRVDLKDTGTSQRWSDASLYLWAKDGIRDYSLHFPLTKDRTLINKVNNAYDCPTDFIYAIDVESPLDRFLERREGRPGTTYKTQSPVSMYYVSGGDLHFNGDPTESVYLTYAAYHGVPASASDTTYTLTIPVVDEELIRLFVKAKAIEQLRASQSNLDRFKLGSGERTDNPLEPESKNVWYEYQDRIAARYQGGNVRLYLSGRRGK